MGFFDFLKDKKQRDAQVESITDLGLTNMRPGFLVDYDLKTWEVKGAHCYEWGDAVSLEWQLVCADDTLYLECETDDQAEWSFSRPIGFRSLGDAVRTTIIDSGDGPEKLTWQGQTFFLEESGGGHFFANGQVAKTAEGVPLLQWSYTNEAEDAYLTIEQWGETDFQAFVGGPAHEYQFTNILPPAR